MNILIKLIVETLLEKYKNYPENPASKKEYILYGVKTIIMEPGKEEVREFISKTIISSKLNKRINIISIYK